VPKGRNLLSGIKGENVLAVKGIRTCRSEERECFQSYVGGEKIPGGQFTFASEHICSRNEKREARTFWADDEWGLGGRKKVDF